MDSCDRYRVRNHDLCWVLGERIRLMLTEQITERSWPGSESSRKSAATRTDANGAFNSTKTWMTT